MQLVEEDRVGLAEDLEPLGGHLAQAADGQAGAGERVPPDQGVGQAELDAQPADLVLEQVAQGLDQLEAELLGQAADVVVDLDRRRRAVGLAAALDHVGVERPLGQEMGAGDRAGLVAEDVDERVADPPPLLLGVDHAAQGLEEPLARRRPPAARRCVREPNASATATRSPARSSPVSTKTQTTRGPSALRQERRADGRIDAAGEPADDPVGRARPGWAISLERSLDERPHRPVPRVLADPVEEVAQDQRAIRRVRDLGVELEPVERQRPVPDRGDRAGRGRGQRDEVRRRRPGPDRRGSSRRSSRAGTSWKSGSVGIEDPALGPAELPRAGTALTLPPSASHASCIP